MTRKVPTSSERNSSWTMMYGRRIRYVTRPERSRSVMPVRQPTVDIVLGALLPILPVLPSAYPMPLQHMWQNKWWHHEIPHWIHQTLQFGVHLTPFSANDQVPKKFQSDWSLFAMMGLADGEKSAIWTDEPSGLFPMAENFTPVMS